MKTRGRDSAASLTFITSNGIDTNRRPQPPVDLTPEQADEWRAVVNRLPADWFPRESHCLLSQYCRHVIGSKRIEQMISSAELDDEFDLDRYDQLLKMRERESRMIASLATKMRISQQSTYDKSRKKPLSPKKPWENAKEDG